MHTNELYYELDLNFKSTKDFRPCALSFFLMNQYCEYIIFEIFVSLQLEGEIITDTGNQHSEFV